MAVTSPPSPPLERDGQCGQPCEMSCAVVQKRSMHAGQQALHCDACRYPPCNETSCAVCAATVLWLPQMAAVKCFNVDRTSPPLPRHGSGKDIIHPRRLISSMEILMAKVRSFYIRAGQVCEHMSTTVEACQGVYENVRIGATAEMPANAVVYLMGSKTCRGPLQNFAVVGGLLALV